MLRRIAVSAALLSLGFAHAGEAGRVVFVDSEALVNGKLAVVGSAVNEGDRLQTGAKGYLYIKMMDNGFFVLRPTTTGRVATYQIDGQNPANTHIKLEVSEGVARHISGDAVKDARENFRLNTPVAAIGVRGTDFTVFTTKDTSSVAVSSGGVVVSPFSGTCKVAGHGPCEGAASRELLASQLGQLVQVVRGRDSAEILRDSKQAPDKISPPHRDESAVGTMASDNANGSPKLDLFPSRSNSIDQLSPLTHTVPSQPPLAWGRWEAFLELGKEIDVPALLQTHQLVGTNGGYALLRSKEGMWQRPEQSAVSFGLQGNRASIFDEQTRLQTAASVENGTLQLDFDKSTFSTQFDLVNQKDRVRLQAQGTVTPDGRLAGNSQFSLPTNMAVQGVLNNDNASAAYLFQSRLDQQRVASGVTYWSK